MGIQPKGAFGGFRNQTGPLVGHIVNGQNVITSIPTKSSKPATEKQLDQRRRFGLVTSFLSWIRILIKLGFQAHEQKQTAMNKAVQYNLRHAVTGVSPQFDIDYPNLRYSVGRCGLPGNMSVEAVAGAKVNFTWGPSVLDFLTKDADQANLVVYNVVKKKFVILENAADRADLGVILQLPASFVGDQLHCYMSFVDATGKVVSNSEYLGPLQAIA